MINPLKKYIVSIRKSFIIFLGSLICVNKKIQNNKIVIDNFLGRNYGDNPKYICDELLKSEINLDIVWVLKDVNSPLPRGIRAVKYGSIRSIIEYLTAKVWIDNVRNSFKPLKKINQFYLQTWHGNLGNKRVEGAAETNLPKDYIKKAKLDASSTDLMISGSTFFTNLIKEFFWYNGEILECGTPRLDIFFQDHSAIDKKVRSHFRNSTSRIILYAPTFRDNQDISCYEMNYERILDTFESFYNDKCIMLIRLHPNASKLSGKIRYNDRIINASDYPDLYELIIVSEAIISDYSSVSFEAGILLKPVFLYAIDIEDYIKQRGFLIDPYEQPYILTVSEDELIDAIIHFDPSMYNDRLISFNEKLGIVENGCSSSIIAKRILNLIKK